MTSFKKVFVDHMSKQWSGRIMTNKSPTKFAWDTEPKSSAGNSLSTFVLHASKMEKHLQIIQCTITDVRIEKEERLVKNPDGYHTHRKYVQGKIMIAFAPRGSDPDAPLLDYTMRFELTTALFLQFMEFLENGLEEPEVLVGQEKSALFYNGNVKGHQTSLFCGFAKPAEYDSTIKQ